VIGALVLGQDFAVSWPANLDLTLLHALPYLAPRVLDGRVSLQPGPLGSRAPLSHRCIRVHRSLGHHSISYQTSAYSE
jgi:hypothetical protein